MATKLGNYEVEEIAPPKLHYSRGGHLTGERVFKVDWSLADDVATALLPSSAITNGGVIIGQGAYWSSALKGLIVESIDCEPFDDEFPDSPDQLGIATCPSGCRMTVRYATLGFDEGQVGGEDGQATLSLSVDVSGEYMTITPAGFTWGSDDEENQYADIDGKFIVPELSFTVTIHRSPILPLGKWQELIGRVNTEAMAYLGYAPPETVLFSGATATKTITTNDSGTTSTGLWELNLSFRQRIVRDGEEVHGWQHAYRPKKGWDRIVLPSGDHLYHEGNLNELLVPQASHQAVNPAEDEDD